MIKAKRKNAMSETVNIRELALDILLNVTKQGEYSHIAEKQVFPITRINLRTIFW